MEKSCFEFFGPKMAQNEVCQVWYYHKSMNGKCDRLKIDRNDFFGKNIFLKFLGQNDFFSARVFKQKMVPKLIFLSSIKNQYI